MALKTILVALVYSLLSSSASAGGLQSLEVFVKTVNSGRAGLKVHHLIAALLDSVRLHAPAEGSAED